MVAGVRRSGSSAEESSPHDRGQRSNPMSNRTKILRSAALCALLGVGGVVRAADGGASAAEPKALELRPVYLQEAAAEAAPRKPLMDLLDRVGLAESLDAAGI